jgi:hypothetical protein
MLAEALEANRQLSELAEGLAGENALLREQVARLAARDAERDAELGKLRADFAVLQRLLFGRSSEKSRPEPPAAGDPAAGDGTGTGSAGPARGGSGVRGRGPQVMSGYWAGRRRPPRRWPMAGCTPVMLAVSTTTGTCTSRTASRT